MVKEEQLILTSTVLLGECVFVLRLICHTIYKNANNIFKKNSRHGVDKQNSKLRAQWDYLDVLWHPYLHSQFWSSIFCFFSRVQATEAEKAFGFFAQRHMKYATIVAHGNYPHCPSYAIFWKCCQNLETRLWSYWGCLKKIRESRIKICHLLSLLLCSSAMSSGMVRDATLNKE